MRLFLMAALLFVQLTSSVAATPYEINLSAAASMTDAVRDLAARFKRDNPDARFLLNFAPSGTLAKQIEQGAPADLFISANPRWMDYLAARGTIVRDSIYILVRNRLVFVSTSDLPIENPKDLVQAKRIALAGPTTAPAGQYAEQALRSAEILNQLRPKLVAAKDVRQALILADRGEVDGAFVYATDARLAQRARVLFTVSSDLHDEIIYPAGLTTQGESTPFALDFFDFLRSEVARAILHEHGFIVPDPEGARE